MAARAQNARPNFRFNSRRFETPELGNFRPTAGILSIVILRIPEPRPMAKPLDGARMFSRRCEKNAVVL
jgi:hypothetical protein